jgi:hypothetical protein
MVCSAATSSCTCTAWKTRADRSHTPRARRGGLADAGLAGDYADAGLGGEPGEAASEALEVRVAIEEGLAGGATWDGMGELGSEGAAVDEFEIPGPGSRGGLLLGGALALRGAAG